jgi:hypothetical protein
VVTSENRVESLCLYLERWTSSGSESVIESGESEESVNGFGNENGSGSGIGRSEK